MYIFQADFVFVYVCDFFFCKFYIKAFLWGGGRGANVEMYIFYNLTENGRNPLNMQLLTLKHGGRKTDLLFYVVENEKLGGAVNWGGGKLHFSFL